MEKRSIFLKVYETLNEAQARWFAAREAMELGRGGIRQIQELTGMSKPTILRGLRELRRRKHLSGGGRVRGVGGGRKSVEAQDPGVLLALQKILEETTGGDPMSPLIWTNKSTTRIAEELTGRGHRVSQRTVDRKLLEWGYSLQVNVKNKEGHAPPQRDQQFRHINRLVRRYLGRAEPVLSVDTKKKERVGNFKNHGKTWRLRGQPTEVNVYDFPSLAKGTAIPYGTYDVGRNEGVVNVGISHDTAEFAVQSIHQWWTLSGRYHYREAKRWLICADDGGSNGSRCRAWKYHLQALADRLGLEISVCHYPAGTSKWNKIEHRLFSFISINWQGRPLANYETVVNLIGSTKTRKGLSVKAKLDKKHYQKGQKVTKQEMEGLNIKYDKINPQWNYTISPRISKGKKR
jgi:hypothetical protein